MQPALAGLDQILLQRSNGLQLRLDSRPVFLGGACWDGLKVSSGDVEDGCPSREDLCSEVVIETFTEHPLVGADGVLNRGDGLRLSRVGPVRLPGGETRDVERSVEHVRFQLLPEVLADGDPRGRVLLDRLAFRDRSPTPSEEAVGSPVSVELLNVVKILEKNELVAIPGQGLVDV